MKKRITILLLCSLLVLLMGANSSTLTSVSDRRVQEPDNKPTWEQVVTFTIEADGGVTEISHTVYVNGNLREMIIEVGAAGGISGTANVDFDDNRGIEFDTNATLAEGSETVVYMNLGVGKVVDDFIIRLTPSDDPTTGSDDWTIVVTCRGD